MRRAASDKLAVFEFTSRVRDDLPTSALRRMARDASLSNLRRGVTGEMRFLEGRFHQIVEGASDTILMLASALLSDPRHEGIEVRGFSVIEARSFLDWRVSGIDASMIFCALRVDGPVESAAPKAVWSAPLDEMADRRA
jgi:hypothetical protein